MPTICGMSTKPPAEKLFCTTVKLPTKLHRQFRIYALARGVTMQAALAEIITAAIAKPGKVERAS